MIFHSCINTVSESSIKHFVATLIWSMNLRLHIIQSWTQSMNINYYFLLSQRVWQSPSTYNYPPVPCWFRMVLWTDTLDTTPAWPPGSGTGRTVPGCSDTCYSRTWWRWAGAAPPYYWSPPRWSGSAGSGGAVYKSTIKNFQSCLFCYKFNGQNFEENIFLSG